MTHRDIVACGTATFSHDHFTITHSQHRRALRHGKVNATVWCDAPGNRVQTTRVKVRGNAELFSRREAHKAFRQSRTAAIVELTVLGTDGVVIFAIRAQTYAHQLALLTLAVEHFARHQHGKLIALLQLAEIHLPLHGFDHRTDFRAGETGITGAGNEASAYCAFHHAVHPVALLHFTGHFETVCSAIVGAGFTAGHLPG